MARDQQVPHKVLLIRLIKAKHVEVFDIGIAARHEILAQHLLHSG